MEQVGNRLEVRSIGPATLRRRAEWAGLTAVLAGAAGLVYFHQELTDWQLATGWLLLGALLIYLLRKGWVRLFGPVLFYDVVRNARRTRTYVTRCCYLAFLLLFLWSYESRVFDNPARGNDPKVLAALAEGFFAILMGVQFVLVVFLTPAYVASSISEEKERKTLEFILATDLDSREIVLGKLVARIGYLGLLLLTGLPVLSAVQFLGGVDPDLVFAGFAATALTTVSLAGISMLASVYANRTRDAILLTYLAMGVYCGFCVLGSFLIEIQFFSTTFRLPGDISIADCVQAFQAGNPFYGLTHLFGPGAGSIQSNVTGVLGGYAIFHILLTLLTVSLAIVLLRPIALREGAVAKKKPSWQRKGDRPVSDRPMIWKERYFSGARRTRRWTLVLIGLLVALTFVPVPFMWAQTFRDSDTAEAYNVYVRTVGTIVACIALLGIAIRGSVAVRIERDKDTMDALLTSPLTTKEILYGKWFGCLWGLRWPGVWLLAIYLTGLLTGGLSLLAVPLLLGAIFVYASTLATVGLWFSIVCKTTVRATVATALTTLGLCGGHWLLWFCCIPFITQGNDFEVIAKCQAGCTPPFVLGGVLTFTDQTQPYARSDLGEFMGYCLGGIVVWALLGFTVWEIAKERFRRDANREVRGPE